MRCSTQSGRHRPPLSLSSPLRPQRDKKTSLPPSLRTIPSQVRQHVADLILPGRRKRSARLPRRMQAQKRRRAAAAAAAATSVCGGGHI